MNDEIHEKVYEPTFIAEIIISYQYDADDFSVSDIMDKFEIARFHSSGMNYINLTYEDIEEFDDLWMQDREAIDELAKRAREILQIQKRMKGVVK